MHSKFEAFILLTLHYTLLHLPCHHRVALTFNKEESGCKADMAPANFLISVHKAGSNGAPIPFVFSDELGTQTFVVDKPVTADKLKIMFLGNRGNPKFICLNDITFHAH
eukprot:TRINITY_DN7393_c0_g2_i1.p1 TRINITY_DN7393_c0_g2~~TRINITY_DN7393_c0_g2_i1.p1  ORF type:complete len:109 (-),score=8.24 TRINITY_DN7393_c0_g2_i1:16-342(-)